MRRITRTSGGDRTSTRRDPTSILAKTYRQTSNHMTSLKPPTTSPSPSAQHKNRPPASNHRRRQFRHPDRSSAIAINLSRCRYVLSQIPSRSFRFSSPGSDELWTSVRCGSGVCTLGGWTQGGDGECVRSEADDLGFMQSHKSFRTKQKLARAQKQNRPIPQWIRLRTGNTIR